MQKNKFWSRAGFPIFDVEIKQLIVPVKNDVIQYNWPTIPLVNYNVYWHIIGHLAILYDVIFIGYFWGIYYLLEMAS